MEGECMRKEEMLIPSIPLNLVGLTPLMPPILTDPMGSYTGLVSDEDEVPVQDADDL